MKIIDSLKQVIRATSTYNPEVFSAPTCILWPDKDRQFESIVQALQLSMPELLVLGEYVPEEKKGPAIWLRCVLSGTIQEVSIPEGVTPILYLPGISRQDLRAIENCPEEIKPIVELQYSGTLWSQINAKDWTILAFLMSDQGGLALDVAQDNETKNAMRQALPNLLDEEIDLLRGKRLDKDYFNSLLTGDPIRDLLQWIDEGDILVAKMGESSWQAFNDICKSKFGFIPKKEGVLAAAANLAEHKGPWQEIWERYCEAPRRYPNIPDQIRKCKPVFDLFADISTKGSWPQENDAAEKSLYENLLKLETLPPHEARKKIQELESEHAARRHLIWAELDQSVFALAIKYLNQLAVITTDSLTAGSIEDLESGYANMAWKADDAVLKTLSLANDSETYNSLASAIRSIYLPWAQDNARYLQKLVSEQGYPGNTLQTAQEKKYEDGDCVLFVDGLRFDTGKRLIELCEMKGFSVVEQRLWCPLPSVTATGKPAVSPVMKQIFGKDENMDFEPSVAEGGQSLKGGYHLKKLLGEAGWKVLERNDNGDGSGKGWCEFGDIDHEGHDRGWKLSKHVDLILKEVNERIRDLLNAGWKRVHVVTDHGWLLMPGGLPKIELPSALADSKWGRCASIKPGVDTEERLFPWFWNPHQQFALADGISCFKKGDEYNHGGLSLQECLVLHLTISNESNFTGTKNVELTDISWRGLRCKVAIDESCKDCKLDIRKNAGDAASSVVMSIKSFDDSGMASVVVEDEDLEGKEIMIVILDTNDELVAQKKSKVGGE